MILKIERYNIYKENLNLNSLLNRETIEDEFKKALNYFEENKNNLLTKRGIYIYGAPGVGKSYFVKKTLKEMNGKDFSKFKENLSAALISAISPIGKRIKDLNNDKSYLLKILKDGSNRARKISEHNLNKIKEIVGFI